MTGAQSSLVECRKRARWELQTPSDAARGIDLICDAFYTLTTLVDDGDEIAVAMGQEDPGNEVLPMVPLLAADYSDTSASLIAHEVRRDAELLAVLLPL
jgi:hypothetical protein